MQFGMALPARPVEHGPLKDGPTEHGPTEHGHPTSGRVPADVEEAWVVFVRSLPIRLVMTSDMQSATTRILDGTFAGGVRAYSTMIHEWKVSPFSFQNMLFAHACEWGLVSLVRQLIKDGAVERGPILPGIVKAVARERWAVIQALVDVGIAWDCVDTPLDNMQVSHADGTVATVLSSVTPFVNDWEWLSYARFVAERRWRMYDAQLRYEILLRRSAVASPAEEGVVASPLDAKDPSVPKRDKDCAEVLTAMANLSPTPTPTHSALLGVAASGASGAGGEGATAKEVATSMV